MTTGIVSLGAYVPLRRLGPGTRDWPARTGRAVANWDEDSLTMAVAAARNCLGGTDRAGVGGLYFATTTPPYTEKLAATTAGWALDLRRDLLTADITDSLRAGTGALRLALDTVKAGSAERVLVTAADRRFGAPNLDNGFGDGAAALLIGNEDVIATVEAAASVSNELLDVWRASGAGVTRSWEDRFVHDEGFKKVMAAVIHRFMTQNNVDAENIDTAVLYAPDLRRHRELAATLGFKKEQVQEPFFDKLGNTGCAFALMQLAAALETAQPGQTILLASYGDGADVMLLKVTDKIRKQRFDRGMAFQLGAGTELATLADYHACRDFAAADPERGGSASASVIARERDAIYALHGVKCRHCGTVQYPPQRICTNCHTQDDFEPYPFADKKGTVFTFTLKYGADIPGFARPQVDTMVDFEGGGRALFGMTDMAADEVKVGMDVEMAFRTLGAGGGIRNYAWRCLPPRETWVGRAARSGEGDA